MIAGIEVNKAMEGSADKKRREESRYVHRKNQTRNCTKQETVSSTKVSLADLGEDIIECRLAIASSSKLLSNHNILYIEPMYTVRSNLVIITS